MTIAQQINDAQTQTRPIDTLPEPLDSSSSKLVYLYLHLVGEAHIDEIQRTLEMKKLALYPVLDTLCSAGLAEREGEQYTLMVSDGE